KENGQGMMFSEDDGAVSADDGDDTDPDPDGKGPGGKGPGGSGSDKPGSDKPKRPSLRVVK
ncbi:MAG: ClpXP protease specificity-enhancing factor, partial [Proteobacteria bacterium]|nr:ClpXP protease specificity-enhancing factor [Pseudomonadota bacterium]